MGKVCFDDLLACMLCNIPLHLVLPFRGSGAFPIQSSALRYFPLAATVQLHGCWVDNRKKLGAVLRSRTEAYLAVFLLVPSVFGQNLHGCHSASAASSDISPDGDFIPSIALRATHCRLAAHHRAPCSIFAPSTESAEFLRRVLLLVTVVDSTVVRGVVV